MTDDLHVERDIVLDQPADEVWQLIGTAAGWQQWLVDEATLEVAAGHGGTVVEDAVVRRVVVTHVDPDRSVSFQWWEADDPASASQVSIRLDVLPDGGSRLRIREQVLHPVAAVVASGAASRRLTQWEVRACLLALALHNPVRV